MMKTARVFHLHFYVLNPQLAEQNFVRHLGMNVVARYGLVGSEQIRFDPDEGWEAMAQAGARFRLTQLGKGGLDLVLGPGNQPEPHLEHFGLRVDEATYQRCKDIFISRGLAYREGERRSFFTTPFGVRIELVAPHHSVRLSDTEMEYAILHIEKARFAVSDPVVCEHFFSDTLGEEMLNQLQFEASDKSTFRPMEIQLSSRNEETPSTVEILSGIQWTF